MSTLTSKPTANSIDMNTTSIWGLRANSLPFEGLVNGVVNSNYTSTPKAKSLFKTSERITSEPDAFFLDSMLHTSNQNGWNPAHDVDTIGVFQTPELISAVGIGGTGIGLIGSTQIAAVGVGGTGYTSPSVITPVAPVTSTANIPIILADTSNPINHPSNSPANITGISLAEPSPLFTQEHSAANQCVRSDHNSDCVVGIASAAPLSTAITHIVAHQENQPKEIQTSGTTDDTTPTLTGTAAPDVLAIRIYDNDEFIGSSNVQTDGSWSLSLEQVLSNGAHDFHINAVTLTGEFEDTSTPWHLTINTAANPTSTYSLSTSLHSIAVDVGLYNDAHSLNSALSVLSQNTTTASTHSLVSVGWANVQEVNTLPTTYIDLHSHTSTLSMDTDGVCIAPIISSSY